jgi:environmental stress-induced protein Ves
MRKLTYDDYTAISTSSRQVLISPADADPTNADYMITLTTFAETGSLPVFHCYDRTVSNLYGGELLLNRSHGRSHLLRYSSEAIQFEGGENIDCQVIGPPVTQCDALTRHGFYAHEVEHIYISAKMEYDLSDKCAAHVLIVADAALLRVSDKRGTELSVDVGDAIVVDGNRHEVLTWLPVAAARVLHVRIYKL